MKLADRTVEIHSSGIRSANQFSIAQTSKMFRILSDSLYSDKIMAVIRELSTNAYDAHIAAGNKNPFKITLPTQANPNFIVRDYGTGLSQNDMEELYTTYGASNKNDSNDFVGCLGLGSKSPFAYTKSFSTISYHNGKKLSYIAAMDEAGVPSLNLVSITDTKEPNGLEISFAIKSYDFNEFTSKSKRIFHYFKMRPIIEGGTCPSINDHSYSHTNVVIEGAGWKIGRVSNDYTRYPSSHNSPGSGVIAIMGNIAYPVDSSKIVGEDKPDQPDHIQAWNRAFGKTDIDNWKNFVREILNAGLYLEIQFSIGELEMDVSREGLQYTKQVIKSLRDRTQDIYLQLKKDMTDKLASATSLVDAYQTYYNLSEIAGGWTAGASWKDSSGKVHELTSGTDLEYKFSKNKLLYAINWRSSGYRSRRLVYLTDKIHSETLSGRPYYGYYNSSSNNKKSGKIAFFRCDVKGEETAKKIVTKYCNQNDCYGYLMIDSDHPEDSTQGFDKIVADIGGESNLLNVSDYKGLLANRSQSGTSRDSLGAVSKDSIFMLFGSIDSAGAITSDNEMNDSSCLKEITDSDDREAILEQDQVVYIPIVRYASVEGFPGISNLYAFSTNEKELFDALIGDTNVFAIKKSYADQLLKKGYNLVSFNDFFKKSLEKLYENKFKDISTYNGLAEYAKSEYEKSEQDNNSGYNNYYRAYTDRVFLFHILNMFGLDYASYIKDSELVSLVDKCIIMEFFAETVHRNSFDIKKFRQADYFAHLTKILYDIGINGVNSKDIRTANNLYHSVLKWVKVFYPETHSHMLKTIKPDTRLKDKLVKIDDLRKQIKEALDKQPMLKYIVASHVEKTDLRSLTGDNPMTAILADNYYANRSRSWYGKMDDVEKFRESVGQTIV